jgi:hypothetical protein
MWIYIAYITAPIWASALVLGVFAAMGKLPDDRRKHGSDV